jgi:hypothetical protein
MLVDFHDMENWAVWVDALEGVDDFPDRRLGTAQVKTGFCRQRVGPRWR